MVNTPVDMEAPMEDIRKTFPEFAKAKRRAVHCDVQPGEALFLPSFHWHEVRSSPDDQGRNTAVNMWFDPFWTKEFPCADCRMELNPLYYPQFEKYVV